MRKVTREISLYPMQNQFVEDTSPIRAFCAGVAAGKSRVGAIDLFCRAERGRTYMVIGPTYPVLRDSSMRSVMTVGRDLGMIDPRKLRLSAPPELTTTEGATFLFRSADDPEKLRGPNLSGVWLDEASLMKAEVIDIALARLREEGNIGWLTATFTPKGQAHWTYERFAKPQPDTRLFRARTDDNPFNPPGFVDLLRRHYVGDFALQELDGEFVDEAGANQVLPSAWVRLAQSRWTPNPPAEQALSALGVDVSRGGADATCIAPRYGNWFAPLKRYRGECTDDGPKAAALVLLEHDGSAPVYVDTIGIGASCYDSLAMRITSAVSVNVSMAPQPPMFDRTGKYRMRNVRAAMYWQFREALDPESGQDLALPPSAELFADLCAARFEVTAAGIIVEAKDKIRERLGRSPDLADAIALAHWLGTGVPFVMPSVIGTDPAAVERQLAEELQRLTTARGESQESEIKALQRQLQALCDEDERSWRRR